MAARCNYQKLMHGARSGRFVRHVVSERGVRHGRLYRIPVEIENQNHAHGAGPSPRHLHVHLEEAS